MGKPLSDYDHTRVVFTWRVSDANASQTITTTIPDGYAVDFDDARNKMRRELKRQYNSVEELDCEAT